MKKKEKNLKRNDKVRILVQIDKMNLNKINENKQ
jgi:hypothetical protein